MNELAQSLEEYVPRRSKVKVARKVLAVREETHEFIAELADHMGLSMTDTMAALTDYLDATYPS